MLKPLRPLPFRPKSGAMGVKSDPSHGIVETILLWGNYTLFKGIWSFSAKMLNHSGHFHFGPKVVFFLIFYNICPYTPFKGISGLGSISWHVETFVVRKLAFLNIWSFSAKMLNHSGPCHFGPKVVFIWFFYKYLPLYPFQRQIRVYSMRSISWHVETFHCEETSPFKYLKFFSQNAEPLRPFPFRPKSGVYLIFYNICPYTPFKGIWGSGSISWHVETFVVRKLAYLNIWSFSAKMLNHSGPCHFGPKVVFIWFFTIFAPTPLSKANEGRQYVHLMACRDFHCEETSPFKYLKFFSQNAEPLRPLPFRPKSGVYLIFYNIYLPPTPLSKANEGQDPSHGM